MNPYDSWRNHPTITISMIIDSMDKNNSLPPTACSQVRNMEENTGTKTIRLKSKAIDPSITMRLRTRLIENYKRRKDSNLPVFPSLLRHLKAHRGHV